jgi:RNA polymerase sigma-70 factor (ECF subfamily)
MGRSMVVVSESEEPFDQPALIGRCLAGDRAAHRELYERHAGFVFRTARRLGVEPDEVEDVVQDVFSVAFKRLATFKSGQLTTWLYRICSNRVTDRHRRRNLRRAMAHMLGVETSAPPSAERDLERHEAERIVSDILGRMSPKKRDVFVLFEIEGLPGDEIAERVGCPVETVWTRLFHARRDFERIGRARGVLEKMGGGQ